MSYTIYILLRLILLYIFSYYYMLLIAVINLKLIIDPKVCTFKNFAEILKTCILILIKKFTSFKSLKLKMLVEFSMKKV